MLNMKPQSVCLRIFFTFLFLGFMNIPQEIYSSPNYFYNPRTLGHSNKENINEQVEKIESYLKRNVPGLSATYREVIDALIEDGSHVYLLGGIVRDLLSAAASEPNDVDLQFTGPVENLIKICEKNHWRYTHSQGKNYITIGDYKLGSIGALFIPKKKSSAGDSVLEFTINNIFYYCNTNSFLQGSEIGLEDLNGDRLQIISDDLNAWLFLSSSHPYDKIFRFWKMVGKGYIYSVKLQNFFYDETSKLLKGDPEGFKKNMINYLGGHFYSFDDVYRGSVAIMGYDWAQENVLSINGEAAEQQALYFSKRDQITYFP